jgi:hypothetical protein
MNILADQLRAVDAHWSAIDEQIEAWQDYEARQSVSATRFQECAPYCDFTAIRNAGNAQC